MSMRVYEFAKKLGMENRDLIPELKKMGVAVASTAAPWNGGGPKSVGETRIPKHKGAVKSTGKRRDRLGARQTDIKSRAGPHTKPASRAHHPGPTDEAKPDKRRILIKRKKTTRRSRPRRSDVEPLAARPSAMPPLVVPPSHAAIERSRSSIRKRILSGRASVQPPRRNGTNTLCPPCRQCSDALKPQRAKRRRSKKSRQRASKTNSRKSESRDVRAKQTKYAARRRRALAGSSRDSASQRRDDRSKHVHHSTPAEITKPRKRASSSPIA